MVYPLDLGSSVLDIVGSSPTTPTKIICAVRRAGSIPVARTKKRGVAQFGRARALGARCRRFKSCHPDHLVIFIE